jgi:cobalt-zinc-cadmium resistance protein CzcA
MVCIFAAIYGGYSWTQLAVEAYPDIADVSSQVITLAPGLAAEEVEQQVTIPLERELNGTPGLLLMRSRSTFGLSLITLVFRDGVEDYWSRHRIRERIQDVPLPPGLTPGLDPLSSPTGQIFKYTLESDTKGLRELSEIQQWTVIPALKQVLGIADIENFGGITTQFQLELDPQQPYASTCRARTSRRHQRQQRQFRRQHHGPRRARLRHPRHRYGQNA